MRYRAPSMHLGTTAGGSKVVVSDRERLQHMHVVGSSGFGKSKFLASMIRQDVRTRQGLCLIDPHGQLYEEVVEWLAKRRYLGRRPIHLVDLSDSNWSFGFNPLDFAGLDPNQVAVAIDANLKACAQVWGGEDTHRTPLLRRILRLIFFTLANRGLTLLEAVPLMSASDTNGVRRLLTSTLDDALFREQWSDFNAMSPRAFQEAFASVNNRLIEFLHTPSVRRMLGSQQNTLDTRALMDEGAIVLVNLGGDQISQQSSALLGALLINSLFLKAFGRAKGARPFTLYVDECHRYLNDDIAGILTQTRKFGLRAVLAHQDLGQLREAGDAVYSAVRSANTKVVFGLKGRPDAEEIAQDIFTGELDYEKVKHTFDRPVVVGQRREVFRGESHGYSSSDGFSETNTDTSADSFGTSEESEFQTAASSNAASEGWTHSESSSHNENLREGLVPIYETMPTAGYSLQELRDIATARLLNLPVGVAIAKVGVKPTSEIRIPHIADIRIKPERVSSFREGVFARMSFATPVAEIDAEIAHRDFELRRLAGQSSPPCEPSHWKGRKRGVVK